MYQDQAHMDFLPRERGITDTTFTGEYTAILKLYVLEWLESQPESRGFNISGI